MKHKHKIEYEFEEGRFPRGWRGDWACTVKGCQKYYFSREAIRMEMFGLMRNPNPPSAKEKETGTADSAMFRVEGIEVKK